MDDVRHDSGTRVVMLRPGEGRALAMGQNPDRMTFKAVGQDTANHLALGEYVAEPNSPGVPLHMHDSHEEGFYVLEGELEMQLDTEVVRVKPGGFVLVPRGYAHRFGNPSDKPCVFLATFSPAGFEELFIRRVQLLEERDLSPEEMRALSHAHGVTYLDSPAGAPRHL